MCLAGRVLLCALAALATFPLGLDGPTAYAGQLSFAWDYSASGAAGFELYCGPASRAYTLRFDVGDAQTYSVSGLTEGARYYCAVTAYDPSRAQSEFSDEISAVVPYSPVANFSAAPTSGIAPLHVTFTNTTTRSVTTWAWDFGDGTTSAIKTPSHSYSTPGSYAVKLTAVGPGGTSTKTAAIRVNAPSPPVTNFVGAPAKGIAPLLVSFTNTTVGRVDSWEWDFGDGMRISDVKSPVHLYTQPGSYTVKLTATNLGGTSVKTTAAPITVNVPPVPVANFTMAPVHGIAPLTVRLANRTVGKVDSWLWDFGDNSTSTEANPSHVFGQPGSYIVKLSATNLGGTGTKTSVAPIVVTPPPLPVANFSIAPAGGHVPLTVQFVNRTTGKVDGWAWDFGDGNASTEKSPSHVYAQVGNYTVTLTATNIGGTSTKSTVTPIAVTLPPAPVANFSVSPAAGTAPLSVRFVNLSKGKVDSWAWDFGDGNTSTQVSPTHVYTRVGNYTVTLSATNPGGISTQASVTPIAVSAPPAPVANFGVTPAKGYAPLSVRSVNTTSGKVDSWAWDFGDGTSSTEKAPTHLYAAPGSYSVKLTATNLGGSSVKVAAAPIVVSLPPLPVANFSMSPASGFAELTVHFTNRSSGKVDSWLWDFGDGTASPEASPTHVYAQVGSYSVKLSATNLAGTAIKSSPTPLTATLPPLAVPSFSATPTSGYAPLSVRFVNRTRGKVDSWLWDFGDGTTSTEANPTHVYTQVGNSTVTLSAINLKGTATTPSATPVRALRPGLVAAYGFEEASGARVADLSGKGHTGVIFGAARVTSGKFGSALSFDGIRNWVTVASSPSLNLTTGLTLEAWVNPSSSSSAWRDVIMKEQPAEAIYDLYADTGAGQPGGGVFMSAENIVSGGTALPANTWTHLATTYDGTNQILYVNGVQVASRAQSGAIKLSAGPLRIGGDSIWGDYFQGLIDEVRVYNRALSASEIQADMTLGIAR